MQYRKDKYGNNISVLGFGCMRFPQAGGKIDMEETEKEIMAAYNAGVNYFDTAYIYPGSEAALGEILEKNQIRDQINIATKLPHYLIRSREGLEKMFAEHLKRLRTDHIDYYLMHMLTDTATWEKLVKLGILEFLEEKKKSGAIRQVGFSYHGNSETFCKLIDVYDWDFCQIQYNYMDEHSQAGRKGLEYAGEKGIPVVIMEPLRGGKLVSLLPEEAKKVMAQHSRKFTPAQWAFRWLWNQKYVTCVLSGMNSMEMVQDNIATACDASVDDLTPADFEMLDQVVSIINSRMKVGCTGCRYCMPCPQGVDIPGTFAAYNRCFSEGKSAGKRDYIMCTIVRKKPTSASNCIGCGKCERHCPQHIEIRAQLKEAVHVLEDPVYKAARFGVKLLKFYG